MGLSGPAVDKGLLKEVAPWWAKINRKAAAALGVSSRGFLPSPDDEKKALGCGAWGCVWPTADERFVLKCSLDATEGPLVSQVIHCPELRLSPGVAYFRAVWKLPNLVWTDKFGFTPVWIMLRERADCDRCCDRRGRPPADLKKVYEILESVPVVGTDLVDAISIEIETQTPASMVDRSEVEDDYFNLLNGLKKTPGAYVGSFMKAAFTARGLILGDVHYGNVGFREHDLTEFGVLKHKKLIVTDLGDQGQPVMESGRHPKIKVLNNPAEAAYWASKIPTL